ncbi:MAG: hypothetical protein LBC85_04720 [Fibromonadaceae bacterium]|nr:hypothetical protein [Fibromonadaceae bacterium]
MESLRGVQCAPGEFRGLGVARTEGEALGLARSMVASQIQSSVSVRSESRTEQRVVGGQEQLRHDNRMQTEQTATLLNAQDAEIKRSVAMSGEVGIVVCMSRENAAKPYLARQKQITDSLTMFSRAAPVERNPRQKKAIWERTSALYNEHVEKGRILQSLGSAGHESENVRSMYEFVQTDYQNFCSNQEIFWKSANDYGSKILFSKLSGDFMLNTGKCESGLQISLLDPEIQCEYKAALGNHLCVFRPILKGESCSGEIFFQLTLNPSVSVTSKTARAAESNLEARIRNHEFNTWKEELKKWVSTCIE